MNECGMHDIRKYKNAPMMRFVMNDVLNVFSCVEIWMGYFDLYSE